MSRIKHGSSIEKRPNWFQNIYKIIKHSYTYVDTLIFLLSSHKKWDRNGGSWISKLKISEQLKA